MSYYSEPDGQLTLLELLSPENTLVLPKQRSASKSVTELVAIPYLYLDLSSDHVDLFGNHYWELRSPHRDGKPHLNTGPAPREPIRSSLAEILEENPEKNIICPRQPAWVFCAGRKNEARRCRPSFSRR